MIRIISKREGFRRCGVAHPKAATEYHDDRFSKKELLILEAEPMLTVTKVADEKTKAKAEAEAKAKAEADAKAKPKTTGGVK